MSDRQIILEACAVLGMTPDRALDSIADLRLVADLAQAFVDFHPPTNEPPRLHTVPTDQ